VRHAITCTQHLTLSWNQPKRPHTYLYSSALNVGSSWTPMVRRSGGSSHEASCNSCRVNRERLLLLLLLMMMKSGFCLHEVRVNRLGSSSRSAAMVATVSLAHASSVQSPSLALPPSAMPGVGVEGLQRRSESAQGGQHLAAPALTSNSQSFHYKHNLLLRLPCPLTIKQFKCQIFTQCQALPTLKTSPASFPSCN